MTTQDEMASRLAENDARLRRLLARQGRGLLRYEALDDLCQGVRMRVLAGAASAPREPEGFRRWLDRVARNHVAERAGYWSAMRRDCARALRLTAREQPTAGGGAVAVPASSSPGPRTFADRRELLRVAARALAALPPRDRQLVQWSTEEVPLAEQAARLGLSSGAAQRAAHRARERLRKTYALQLRTSGEAHG